MAICVYCGKKTGWFATVHQKCVARANAGAELIRSSAKGAVFEGRPYSTISELVSRTALNDLVSAEKVRQAVKEGWSSGAEELAMREAISFDSYERLSEFYTVAGFGVTEMIRTRGGMISWANMVVWSVMNGTPMITPTPHPFNLTADELPIVLFGGVVYSQETTVRSTSGVYSGLGVSLGHGLFYHFGGLRSQSIDTHALRPIDGGKMLLTTKNIYFGGAHTTFRMPYAHVVSFRAFSDGLGVFREGVGRLEIFAVTNDFPCAGAYLFNLAQFLAKPAARDLYSDPRILRAALNDPRNAPLM